MFYYDVIDGFRFSPEGRIFGSQSNSWLTKAKKPIKF